MPSFPKPNFSYDYEVDHEISKLRQWKAFRNVAEKKNNSLLIATWNVANLGDQQRRPKDYRLIAEIISWFDVIALQEVKENLDSLSQLVAHLGSDYRVFYTDASGNNERMTFFYDSTKVRTRELVGEVAPYPHDLKNIKLPGVQQKFEGFDRNPFIQSFLWSDFRFCLTNVHLYFGSAKNPTKSIERRQLETLAVARWATQQAGSKHNSEPDIILLGDFNLPFMEQGDPIYKILLKYGLVTTEHSTEIGTTLPTESKGKTKTVYHYDQIAFFPNTGKHYTQETGVFDFDGALFGDLWKQVEQKKRKQSEFNAYVKYYISDHRLLWAKFT